MSTELSPEASSDSSHKNALEPGRAGAVAGANVPSQPLAGQVAIVTGGATGIGSGIAAELARRGASVVVNHFRQADIAQKLCAEIDASGGKSHAIDADISKPEDVARLVEKTVATFGRLDIMVANAGIQVDAPALEMSYEQWQKALGVDLTGSFLCAQAAARQFVKQTPSGNGRAIGKVLCMLSVHDSIPWAGHVNYAAAKGGAHMMMQTLAQEWAAQRIRVVGISPGAIRTPINQSVWGDPAKYEELLKLIPYGRIGEIEDVARVAAWLVSDEADYITGTTLYVDGGMMQYPGFQGNG